MTTALEFQLTLVRHGQTVNNLLQLLQGQLLDTPLNTVGRLQARAVGRALSDVPFTHIYCSDMRRAVETCRMILEENRSQVNDGNHSRHCEADERLRERCMGVMEGRPTATLRREAARQMVHRRVYTPEGGETLEEVSRRLDDFFTLGEKYHCNIPKNLLEMSCKNASRTEVEVTLAPIKRNANTNDNESKRLFSVWTLCRLLFDVEHL